MHFFAIRRNAWDTWFPQGMVLGALFCLSCGLARFLARYHLIIDGHSAVVAGASWVDIHFWLPAYAVIIAAWVAPPSAWPPAACVPRLRRWLFAAPSHWVGAVRRFRRGLPRSGDHPDGGRASLCRPQPDNPRTALPRPQHRRHAAGLRACRAERRRTGIRRFGDPARPRRSRQERGNLAGCAHLGLARARTPAAADSGPAPLLHVRQRRYRPLPDRWRRTPGDDHRARTRCRRNCRRRPRSG